MTTPTLTTITLTITALTAAAALIGKVVRGAASAMGWLEVGRLKGTLDRRVELLQLADRLEDIGEPGWATETRKSGEVTVVRLLARFEVNRAHPHRATAEATGFVLFWVAIASGIAGRWHPWFTIAAVGCEFGMLGIGVWWLVTQPSIEREVREVTKKRGDTRVETHGLMS